MKWVNKNHKANESSEVHLQRIHVLSKDTCSINVKLEEPRDVLFPLKSS